MPPPPAATNVAVTSDAAQVQAGSIVQVFSSALVLEFRDIIQLCMPQVN